MNGNQIGSGNGSAILGDPVKSVLWINNKLKEFGRSLTAGQLVMTGSIIQQFPLTTGDVVEARFCALGTVQIEVQD
jgi:2-keto-4-pentenoate hydratase